MALTDILPIEGWLRFEKELHDRFDLNCSVYNTSGVGITGRPNWCNRLCPRIKANKESLAAICAAGNQYFMRQAKETGQPVVDECDAGLFKIAVPVFVNGEFLGTVGGCGRLPEGGNVETFIIQKTTQMDEHEIRALCRELKPMSENQALQAAEYIAERIAEYVKKDMGKPPEGVGG